MSDELLTQLLAVDRDRDTIRALAAQIDRDFAALRERAERAEAQAAQYAALRERERLSALAQHDAQQQRLNQAFVRNGELQAFCAAQAQAAQSYLDALRDTPHGAAQLAARGCLMRVLGAATSAAALRVGDNEGSEG